MQLRSWFDRPASPAAKAFLAQLAPLVAGFAAVVDHDRLTRPGLAEATGDIASLAGITGSAETPSMAALELAADELSHRVSYAAAAYAGGADVPEVAALVARFAVTVQAYSRAQHTFDQTRTTHEPTPSAPARGTGRPVRSVMTVPIRRTSPRPAGQVR